MGTYHPLFNIRIEHEYFDGNICRALQCRISPSGQALWHRRGLLFRQILTNEWTILYDDAGAGVDTYSDVLALELVMTDPAFVLYTRWNNFQPFSAYRLDLPVQQEMLNAAEAIVEHPSRRICYPPLLSMRIFNPPQLPIVFQQCEYNRIANPDTQIIGLQIRLNVYF